jgi:hypothetical protein
MPAHKDSVYIMGTLMISVWNPIALSGCRVAGARLA